jgi:hypothetical protein
VGELQAKAGLGLKTERPFRNNKKEKIESRKDWGCGSSSLPLVQVQDPEFKPQNSQRKKKRKNILILLRISRNDFLETILLG